MELTTRTSSPRTQTPAARAEAIGLTAWIKVAYSIVGCATAIYFLLRMFDGGNLATAAEQASRGMLYGITGLIMVFGVVAVGVSFRRSGTKN